MTYNYKKMSTFQLYLLFISGYTLFLFNKRTKTSAYRSMRELFVRTNGKLNNVMSSLCRLRSPNRTSSKTSEFFGNFSTQTVNEALQNLETKGFHIFTPKLPLIEVDKIVSQARQTPLNYVKPQEENNKKLKIEHSSALKYFDSKNPVSPRYFFSMDQILAFPTLQALLFDPLILSVARAFFKCEPVLDLFAMWWSAPFGGKATKESAQEYHFDMDRLKFVKFFIYLTDVTPENGPHCYIENSHKTLPKELLEDRRFTHEELTAFYSTDKIHELYGEKGTLMVVDTRGLHRGKPLVSGERLIFQIEFANNIFGQTYPPIDKGLVSKKHLNEIHKNAYLYQILK